MRSRAFAAPTVPLKSGGAQLQCLAHAIHSSAAAVAKSPAASLSDLCRRAEQMSYPQNRANPACQPSERLTSLPGYAIRASKCAFVEVHANIAKSFAFLLSAWPSPKSARGRLGPAPTPLSIESPISAWQCPPGPAGGVKCGGALGLPPGRQLAQAPGKPGPGPSSWAPGCSHDGQPERAGRQLEPGRLACWLVGMTSALSPRRALKPGKQKSRGASVARLAVANYA